MGWHRDIWETRLPLCAGENASDSRLKYGVTSRRFVARIAKFAVRVFRATACLGIYLLMLMLRFATIREVDVLTFPLMIHRVPSALSSFVFSHNQFQ